jgi:hypothetical protein
MREEQASSAERWQAIEDCSERRASAPARHKPRSLLAPKYFQSPLRRESKGYRALGTNGCIRR